MQLPFRARSLCKVSVIPEQGRSCAGQCLCGRCGIRRQEGQRASDAGSEQWPQALLLGILSIVYCEVILLK